MGLGVFGIVAEPNKFPIGMANPGYMMEDIAEESSSIGSSIPGTPLLGAGGKEPTQGSGETHHETEAASDQEEQLGCTTEADRRTAGDNPT